MLRGDQDRLTGTTDDRLGRRAEDRPAAEVEVFAPLGQEYPVAASAALLDDRLVDHADDLLRVGTEPRRFTLLAELGEDSFGLGLEAAFDGREQFLIRGSPMDPEMSVKTGPCMRRPSTTCSPVSCASSFRAMEMP